MVKKLLVPVSYFKRRDEDDDSLGAQEGPGTIFPGLVDVDYLKRYLGDWHVAWLIKHKELIDEPWRDTQSYSRRPL